MDQDLSDKPKNFPLGYAISHVHFPIEKSNSAYDLWVPTIHNIDWTYRINTLESDQTNKIQFTLCQNKEPEPFQSMEVEVGVVVENLESQQYNIKVEGKYEFNGKGNNEMKLEIPGFDKIIDWKQSYFDDKKSEKEFKIRLLLVVKSVRLFDSVEYMEFYGFDPTIHDIEVNVMGHAMSFSKKLVALQSSFLAAMLETQNIADSDLPSSCDFDIFYDFLQLIHGVDLALNKDSISPFLDLAHHLQVPRVTEYCKKQMISGCGGLTNNMTVELAGKWSFWDLVPRKLGHASCLAELKAQGWNLDSVQDEILDLIAKRMFELDV